MGVFITTFIYHMIMNSLCYWVQCWLCRRIDQLRSENEYSGVPESPLLITHFGSRHCGSELEWVHILAYFRPTNRGRQGILPRGTLTFFLKKKGLMRLLINFIFNFIFFRFSPPYIYFCCIVWTQSVNALVERSVRLSVKDGKNTLMHVNTWHISLINS